MKSHEVLTPLKISRPTLTKYVKTGAIKVITLPNLETEDGEDQGGDSR